jgi:hypothetical protein
MPTPKQGATVRFVLFSQQVLPDEMQKCVGIQPDLIWHIGDPVGRTGILKKDHSIVFESPNGAVSDIRPELNALLDRLKPAVHQIRSLTPRVIPLLDIVVRTADDKETPILNFPPDVIAFLSDCGAEIDIDLLY